MSTGLPQSLNTQGSTAVVHQEGKRYTVDYTDATATAINRDALTFLEDGPLRYVRTVFDTRAVLNFGSSADDASWSHCWVEHHPAVSDTDSPVTIVVPKNLRAGDVLEFCPANTDERPAGGFYTISTYAVVQSVTGSRLELVVFGIGLKMLAQACAYSEEHWGQAFTPDALGDALRYLRNHGTTGRGAQCLDMLLRAMADAPDSQRHQVALSLARDYAQNQRPSS